MSEKTYLGGGVYAEQTAVGLKVTTEDGVQTTNTIYFGARTLASLLDYVDEGLSTPAPTWSKEPPSDPGWFWFQPADLIERRQPIQISRNAAGHLRASKASGAFYPVEELKGLWFGERLKDPKQLTAEKAYDTAERGEEG
jgi:hypothetical protein